MRTSVIIAKAATRATWPLTRMNGSAGPATPVVLCYHRVLPRTSGCRESAAYAVTLTQFAEQMRMLASEGFTSLTLDDFRQAARGRREVPRRSVLMTFDDGFADTYLSAWPIARESGITLNLFLCTGLLGGEHVAAFDRPTTGDRASRLQFPHLWQPLQWDQVREMRAAGVGVGFHSHTHRNCAQLNPAEISEDTSRGLAHFDRELGTRPACFAFPYGHNGSYSAGTINALKEQGLQIFFSTELGRTPLSEAGPFSRIVIHPEDDLQSFKRKLYGGYDWVGRLRQFGYSVSASVRPLLKVTRASCL